MMKATPPTSAPTGPATVHAHKMESCVDAGPGNRLHAARASSKCAASIHFLRSTQRSRSNAMCVGGPPKPMHPIRAHCTNTSRRLTRAAETGGSVGATGARYGRVRSEWRPQRVARRNTRRHWTDAAFQAQAVVRAR
jgi:hypothetical protein